MVPTTFRTVRLNLVGTPNAAVSVAGFAPYARRVLLLTHEPFGAFAFIAGSVNELNSSGPAPAGAVRILGTRAVTIALPAGQGLSAAGSVAGAILSVSVSQSVPAWPTPMSYPPTMMSTILVPASGFQTTPRLVAASPYPRRVTIQPAATGINVRIASSAEELDAFGANPAGAFAFDEGEAPITFVLAPNQPIYGTFDIGSPVFTLSMVSTPEMAPTPQEIPRTRPTFVRRYVIPAGAQPVRIVPNGSTFRHVLINPAGGGIVSTMSTTDLVSTPIGSNVYSLQGTPQTFVISPGQALYAAPGTYDVEVADALYLK